MKMSLHETQADVLIMRAEGGFSESLAIEVFQDLKKRIDEGLRKIIYDCSDTDFISSLDLGLLARIHSKIAMAGGDMKLCSVKGMIPQVLQITNMDKVFDIHPDLDSARKAFESFQPRSQ